MQDLRQYVCRAADEFHAADRAACPQSAEAHRLLAVELVQLIKCDGNATSYRIMRKRRSIVASLAAADAVNELHVA